ncbi:MAG: VWA domain-containing protein [Deltaproteobacteria bacterium]|nr:VWA domain-containing protein [Deltaproteobacteria bacterium]
MRITRSGLWALALLATTGLLSTAWCGSETTGPGQGSLTIIEPDGKQGKDCPLEHTDVKADISGFIARVSVKQIFHNPSDKKIEAVYTFPLSAEAAVDDMLMKVGKREVRGVIKRKEEARQIYEQARDRGHVASLLDQERPNIFTQSVANIMPGEKVEITIHYSEALPYDDGSFKFVFPMVVGPRFIPGEPGQKTGTGWASDTDQVPDASRITPPVTPEGIRAGHDLSLQVVIDAGVPILGIDSKLHEIAIERDGAAKASVSLKNKKEIPNKDFVLSYLVAGDEVKSGVLAHKDGKEGSALLIMIPPRRVKPEQIAPKEMIFVIDCSGSQAGWPIAKAKEAMRYFIERMNPEDTFNVIDFNVSVRMLFPEPKKNTADSRIKALRYLESLEARGGTWMGPAVEAVAKAPAPENRLRIVTFMTDGYVGNDFEIISLVQKLRGASRWFPFGTGNSVNRFLLDNMARVGGGEVEYVLLNSRGQDVGRKFYERIANPVLTDMSITTEGIKLEELFPTQVSDLWDRKPLVFKARYTKAGKGKIILKGLQAGKPYEQVLDVTLPETETANASLAPLWARAKVDSLMDQDFMGIQRGKPRNDIKEEIIRVALEHRIMTQFTSFVAVEEAVITTDGKPVRVTVPVEMPDGVSREGVFGETAAKLAMPSAPMGRLPASGRSPEGYNLARAGSPVAAAKRREGALPAEALVETTGRSQRAQLKDEQEQKDAESGRRTASIDKEKDLPGLEKLTADLRTLIEAVEKGQDTSKGKVRVKDGKVTVQVWLTQSTEAVLKELKEKGLTISFTATGGKLVIGAVEVKKLVELAKIAQVRLIEPLPEA